MLRTWTIKDQTGAPLYTGEAKTKKEFILKMVNEGKSLQGADFFRHDLSGLDLSNADLRECRFNEADIRGTQFRSSDLSNSTMIKVKGQGTRFDNATLCDVNFTNADLDGTRMTHAVATGSRFINTNLENASCGATIFNRCHIENTSFRKSTMTNSDWSFSSVMSCDFSGAKIFHKAFTNVDDETREKLFSHLIDRTRGAMFVGCSYNQETELSDTVPLMVSDRRVSSSIRYGLWATSTLGILGTLDKGFEFAKEEGFTPSALISHLPYLHNVVVNNPMVGDVLTGAILVGVFLGVNIIKEQAGEWLRDKAEDALNYVIKKTRETMKAFDRQVSKRMNLVAMVCKTGSLSPIKLALTARAPEAEKKGFWSGFKSFFCDLGHVVLCDRRHLALAFATLSAMHEKGGKREHDFVLVRCDGNAQHHENSPCAVTLYREGGASVVWPVGEHQHISIRYNRDGSFRDCYDGKGNPTTPEEFNLPPEASDNLLSIMKFEASLLKDHNLEWLTYPHDTHKIENGRDGSLLVQRRQDRRLDNPTRTASIIRPDNSAVLVMSGSVVGELDKAHVVNPIVRPCKVLSMLEIPKEEIFEDTEVEKVAQPTI